MSAFYRLLSSLLLVAFLWMDSRPPPVSTRQLPAAAPQSAGTTIPASPNPYHLISEDSLFAYLEDLTSIQPYSGWRNSGSSGEAEALDYVARKLDSFTTLKRAGLELERQSFNVYMATEIRDSRLTLTLDGRAIEVPADGLRGARGYRPFSLYFDSDGVMNDTKLNPVHAAGAPVLVADEDTLANLTANDIKNRVLLVKYSVVDSSINSEALANGSLLVNLMEQGPAGVVLMTTYSNRAGEGHGSFVGEGGPFLYEIPVKRVPVLYARLEDLSLAGITRWEDLRKIQSVGLDLDSDVFSPARAGNLIARIPGSDSSRAVILGAHIDSPNGPGAFDDGSGSAALLEVARVLDVSRIRPPVDVYLAWFGGHEIGTYGSAHFAATHQDLLDRTIAQVQMDGLGRPLDNKTSQITLMSTTYGRFDINRQPLPDLLAASAASRGIAVDTLVDYGLIADNSNFDAYNVPNVWLGYVNGREWSQKSSAYFHYANHMHDAYETAALAREVAPTFVQMTAVLLSAALELGRVSIENSRVTPAGTRTALFIATHTEPENVPASMLRELGMALSLEGMDVDLIPYGQPFTVQNLKDVAVVILPPTLDFPGRGSEKWSEAELDLLRSYVAGGGFLVVVNSACNYSIKRCLDDINEDTRALNPLLEPMGLAFRYVGTYTGATARSTADHPLTAAASYLTLYEGQGVPFRLTAGLELYHAGSRAVVALLDHGSQGGQVLVISDLGLLQTDSQGAKNMEFIRNIAHYAGSR